MPRGNAGAVNRHKEYARNCPRSHALRQSGPERAVAGRPGCRFPKTPDRKASAEAAQRQRACEDSRAYLKNLQAGNRVAKVDPKTGERAFLEDAQYANEIAAVQKMVDTNCK